MSLADAPPLDLLLVPGGLGQQALMEDLILGQAPSPGRSSKQPNATSSFLPRIGSSLNKSSARKPAIIRLQASHGFARLHACPVSVFAME
jgi:hypothetical protein